MSAATGPASALLLLLALSLKILLILGVAAVALRCFGVSDPARRHRAWTAVLVAMLALLPLELAAPKLALPILPRAGGPAVAAASPSASPTGAVRPAAATLAAAPTPTALASGAASIPWMALVLGLYLAGVAWQALRLATGLLLGRRLVARATPLADPALLERARLLAAVAGLGGPPEVRSSPQVKVPLVIGARRPAILLPAGWSRWGQAKLSSVLAHELAHIRRADLWIQNLAALNRCIYWFHPAAHLVARQLSLLAEQTCDALAIRWLGNRQGYARHLLEVAAPLVGSPGRVLAFGAPMARPSQLGRRLEAILKGGLLGRPEKRRGLALAWLTTVAALLLVSTVRLGAVGDEPQSHTAASTVPALIQALSDPSAAVRAEAARSLRQTGDARAIPALQAALDDPDMGVRGQAALALLRLDPGGSGPTLRIVTEGAPVPRGQAVPLSEVEDPETLRQVAQWLEDHPSPAPVLAPAGEAEPEDASQEAESDAEAAAPSPATAPRWVEVDGKQREVLQIEARPLREVSDAELLRKVSQVLAVHGEMSPEEALGTRRRVTLDPRTTLVILTYDVMPETRARAAWALERLGQGTDLSGLYAALGSSAASDREQAAWALGVVRDAAAAARLRALLDDPQPEVRERAAWALEQLGC